MVRIIDYKARMSAEGEPFLALIVQGGITLVKSKETGLYYATAKKANIPSTFDEETCKSLIGQTSDKHFMAANTVPVSIEELSRRHTIPVFAKDNESTISHQEFIETIAYVSDQIFGGETILKPSVRVSHPTKGRIPSAVGKPAK